MLVVKLEGSEEFECNCHDGSDYDESNCDAEDAAGTTYGANAKAAELLLALNLRIPALKGTGR
jgi:hypothetical protein